MCAFLKLFFSNYDGLEILRIPGSAAPARAPGFNKAVQCTVVACSEERGRGVKPWTIWIWHSIAVGAKLRCLPTGKVEMSAFLPCF